MEEGPPKGGPCLLEEPCAHRGHIVEHEDDDMMETFTVVRR